MNLELAIQTLRDNGYTVTKRKAPKAKLVNGFADYDMAKVKNAKVAFPSPVIAATFADGETVRMSFATQVGKPLNVGRAVRVAIDAYDARHKVRDKKRIALAYADVIDSHDTVRNKRHRREWMRVVAIKTAEALELHRATARPEYISGCNMDLSEFQKAQNAAYFKWGYTESELERKANKWADRYTDAIAHEGHAREAALDALVKQHSKRVNVPAITHAHVEVAGQTVATLDLEKVNATAKAKLNGGLH